MLVSTVRRKSRVVARAVTVSLALSVVTAVAAPVAASAATGPSVSLPTIPSVPVATQPVQGRPTDQASLNSLSGNQTPSASSVDGGGNYGATTMSASASWNVSAQTGDFSWSYPISVPQVPGGLVPTLAVSYRSSAVDGLTSATNNQASWVGDGWSLGVGFIERAYGGCADDTMGGTTPPKTGDLCWRTDNAVSSSGGALIKVDDTLFRFQDDDGTRVQRIRQNGINADNDGEYWKVTSVDGSQYFYGSRSGSNSTWTVPVFGDDKLEPCNSTAGFDASSCAQAWRWNLDKVIDPRGNVIVYTYDTETNSYGRNLKDTAVSYVRGGALRKAEYGLRDDLPGQPLGVVDFVTGDRCVPGSECVPTKPENWPDVPWTDKCDTATCKDHYSPTFWTTKRLTKVVARAWNGTAHVDVDSWTLDHQYPTTGDGEKPALWLKSITRTGHVGSSPTAPPISLPSVVFEGKRMPNRVEAVDGVGPLMRYRIIGVISESGGVTEVVYAPPNCVTGSSMPASPESNVLRCFPSKWKKKDFAERTDHFHKYVVETITSSDRILKNGDPGQQELANARQITRYEYLDGAAWRYNRSEFAKDADKTWDEFRGYGRVRVHSGVTGEASPITMTEQRFHRGMHGDKLPSGTRTVSVTDSEKGPRVDEDWLNGFPYESSTHLGQTETVINKSISTPAWRGPTATRDTFKAYMVNPGVEEKYTAVGPGWRKLRVEYTHNDHGQQTKINELGDVDVTGDERCTRVEYAVNEAAWMVAYPSRSETVVVACGTAASYPGDALGDARIAYDGQAFGAAPTRGNATRSEGILDHPTGADTIYAPGTSSTYDRYGRALTVTSPTGATTTVAYTPAEGGPVTQVKSTAAFGLSSTMTVSPLRGITTKTVGARSEVSELEFDALGRTTQVWLPNRFRSRSSASYKYAYDIRNDRPSSVTTSSINTGGTYTVTTSILDGLYRVRQQQVPTEGGRLLTDVRYDSQGRAYKSTQPYFNANPVDTTLWVASDTEVPGLTFAEFDGAGRQVASIYKTGSTEKWRSTTAYEGDRVHVTPPQGGIATTTISDALGRTTEVRQYKAPTPTGEYETTAYTYDRAGRLASTRDAAGTQWRWFHDVRGLQIRTEDPDKGVATSVYNTYGQLEVTTDALGQVLAFKYDILGRRTEVREGGLTGTLSQQFTYDTAVNGKGLPAVATRFVEGAAYVTKFDAYTLMGQPSKASVVIPEAEGALQGTYSSNYTYTFDGQVSGETLPAVPAAGLAAESVTRTFDGLGREVDFNAGTDDIVSATTYTKYGEVQRVELGAPTLQNRAWMTSIYESDTRRLQRYIVDTETPAPMQSDVNFTRDAAGNVLSITDRPLGGQTDQQCFKYDHLRRLTEAWTPSGTCAQTASTTALSGPAPYWHSYAYDESGNRRTEERHAAMGDTTRTYNYDPVRPHRLDSVTSSTGGTDSFKYDALGNTTARTVGGASQILDWDAEGRVKKITEGTKVSEFVYATNGTRLLRKDPDATTLYLGDQEIRLATGTNTPSVTRYYRHNGQMVAMRQGGKLTWLTGDHQGTANLSFDTATKAVTKRRQLPFGGERGTGASALAGDRGFVGGVMDGSTGLVHIGARQFDPAIGRFISVDPILDLKDPQSWSGYAYSNNSPITFSDPSGLWCDMCNGGKGWTNVNGSDNVGSEKEQARYEQEQERYNIATGKNKDRNKQPKIAGRPIPTMEELQARRIAARGYGDGEYGLAVHHWATNICTGSASIPQDFCTEARDMGLLERTPPGLITSLLLGPVFDGRDCLHGSAEGCVDLALDLIPIAKIGKRLSNAAQQTMAKYDDALHGLCPTGGNSFSADTQVLLADGTTTRIDQVEVGDVVLATDPETGETSAQTVTAVHLNYDTELTDLMVVEADGDVATIRTTDDHKVWDDTVDRWIDAGDLLPGHRLRTVHGQTAGVAFSRAVSGAEHRYDLTVQTLHTYYVVAGTTPVLVHNTNGCVPGASTPGKGRAPEFDGGTIRESEAMGAAEKWLGQGYKEVGNGRYVSMDGQRVVRYGNHEVKSRTHHIHFEAVENGRVVENTSVRIVP